MASQGRMARINDLFVCLKIKKGSIKYFFCDTNLNLFILYGVLFLSNKNIYFLSMYTLNKEYYTIFSQTIFVFKVRKKGDFIFGIEEEGGLLFESLP